MSEADQTGQVPQNRGTPRWVWITLVASLAVNLLVIGAIGGSMWVHRHGGPGFSGLPAGTHHMRRFVRGLPEERRTEVRRVLGEARRMARPRWREVRQARRAALAVLEREPFDRKAYAGALAQIHAAEKHARSGINQAFVDFAAALTPEERRAFAKWVRERRGHRRYWRRKFHERRLREEREPAPLPPR